jgi:hypothetical protein
MGSGPRPPTAALYVHCLEAGCLRYGKLPIVGRDKRRAESSVRCGDVKEVQTASQELGGVETRELARFCENAVKIERHRHEPLMFNIVTQLRLHCTMFVPRHQLAPDELLEGVRNFQLVERSKRDLASCSNG